MKILSYCRALLYTCAVLLCGLLRGAVGRGLPFFFCRSFSEICVVSITGFVQNKLSVVFNITVRLI